MALTLASDVILQGHGAFSLIPNSRHHEIARGIPK